MCLALFALAAHPRHALVVAANRDEYHARPTQAAHWWSEGWLAGRDLTAGGTWLGVTRQGRWALVTNVREHETKDPGATSRGQLVLRFLQSSAAPVYSLHALVTGAHRHNGFNLVGGQLAQACWGSNRGPKSQALAAGIYGLSNHQLDTPWPKLRRTKDAFARWCGEDGKHDSSSIEALFGILHDTEVADDADLPATGVSVERERLLSAPFVVSPTYGTRSSTILIIAHDGAAYFIERSFDPAGQAVGEVEFRFALER